MLSHNICKMSTLIFDSFFGGFIVHAVEQHDRSSFCCLILWRMEFCVRRDESQNIVKMPTVQAASDL